MLIKCRSLFCIELLTNQGYVRTTEFNASFCNSFDRIKPKKIILKPSFLEDDPITFQQKSIALSQNLIEYPRKNRRFLEDVQCTERPHSSVVHLYPLSILCKLPAVFHILSFSLSRGDLRQNRETAWASENNYSVSFLVIINYKSCEIGCNMNVYTKRSSCNSYLLFEYFNIFEIVHLRFWPWLLDRFDVAFFVYDLCYLWWTKLRCHLDDFCYETVIVQRRFTSYSINSLYEFKNLFSQIFLFNSANPWRKFSQNITIWVNASMRWQSMSLCFEYE